MGLKQDIVVKSEFTTKTPDGGTRGGSPDNYVLQYMARDGAVESIAPIRKFDEDDYEMRYRSRSKVVDDVMGTSSDVEGIQEIKDKFKSIHGKGGVAFGYGEYSLSNEKIRKIAKDLDKQFENGKTVMKTVVSFDEEYLRKQGIIDKDFHFVSEGDYRGNIDQMKLRMAIMKGMDKMSKNYDDLQYVGIIHVDTKHVHCHLAMVDRGKGRLMSDGAQKGKITAKDMQYLRRGIDNFLDETQKSKMMSSSFGYEKHNVNCFVKKYTHKAIEERGFSQFLLACLPKRKDYWRASTHRKDMQKANSIVRSYVEELFKQPDSGYEEAISRVDAYARDRVVTEGLTRDDYRQLYNAGRSRLVEDAMNSVYSVLKNIPDSELRLRTPLLDAMSMPYDDMANMLGTDENENSMVEFGFKLRSYKTRLDHHKAEHHKYHDAVIEYEKQQAQGLADEASKPLYDFFVAESEYNAMLVSKYRHFLRFIPPEDDYMQEFEEFLAYDKRVHNYESMISDPSIKRMRSDNAERYGLNVYGEHGGRDVAVFPDQAVERLDDMKSQLADMRDKFAVRLSDYGMRLSDDNRIENVAPYRFEDVKALDLHHLLYDFPYDFNVAKINAKHFVDGADKRYDAFMKAKEYLEATGQEFVIESLPENDIMVQHNVADKFREDDVLHTSRMVLRKKKEDSRTVRIDYDFYVHQEEDIKNVVKSTISSLQYE